MSGLWDYGTSELVREWRMEGVDAREIVRRLRSMGIWLDMAQLMLKVKKEGW